MKLWDKNHVNWSYSHGQPVWFVELQRWALLAALALLVYGLHRMNS